MLSRGPFQPLPQLRGRKDTHNPGSAISFPAAVRSEGQSSLFFFSFHLCSSFFCCENSMVEEQKAKEPLWLCRFVWDGRGCSWAGCLCALWSPCTHFWPGCLTSSCSPWLCSAAASPFSDDTPVVFKQSISLPGKGLCSSP